MCVFVVVVCVYLCVSRYVVALFVGVLCVCLRVYGCVCLFAILL